MDYTLIKDSSGNLKYVRRLSDNASIPTDPANMDYQRYLIDVDNGATVDEVVIPDPSPQPDRLADIEAALLDLAEMLI